METRIHEEKAYEIEPELVYVSENRHRRFFPQKEMDKLITSISSEVGQIQPGVCHTNAEGRIELGVGERRLRACGYAKKPFSYILKEEITDLHLLERIQLEENLVRHDLDWKDEVAAKERIHLLFQEQFGETKTGKRGGHGLADTAEHLGEGRSILHEDIQLAVWAREVPEVAAAPNKTTAKKVVKRLMEQVQRQEALNRVFAGGEGEVLTKATSVAKTHDADELRLSQVEAEKLSQAEKQLLEFNRRILLGKMEDRVNDFQSGSIDIVLFDPPWGVEYHEVKKKVYGQKDYKDDKDIFRQDLSTWLSRLFLKMAENSHLYMFFGIVDHEFVYRTLEQVGFQTNRIPLIWYKEGSRRTRNPHTSHGRAYEPIAFGRKGNKVLAKPGFPNVIVTPQPSPTIKDIHPSAKHPEVYRQLLVASAAPGDTMLDPMSGSGMAGVAAEELRSELGLDWHMIEADKDYRNLAIFNLNKGFAKICGEKI